MDFINPDQVQMASISTGAEQFLRAAGIALRMQAAQIPHDFVAEALELARHNRGVYELMVMWDEERDSNERAATVADIQELLDDAEAAPAHVTVKPRVGFSELDDIAGKVIAAKANLRAIIDKHGGISAVARLTGIPQPSLSRMLGSASMPRRATLYKIASALRLDETEIASDFTW